MSQPLDAHAFELWWHTLTVYQLSQSKEGRDQLKIARDGRLVAEQERAMAAALADGDIDDAGDGARGRIARRRRIAYPDGPTHDLTDGTRASGALFTNPARLLQVLAPDDPRAIYVRAGGRLDASGNPIPPRGSKPASSPAGMRPGERSFDELQAAGWQPLAPGAPLDPMRPPPPGPPPTAVAAPLPPAPSAPTPAAPASFAALARAPALPDGGPPGT